MKIDLKLLAKLDACSDQLVLFEKWLGPRTRVDLTDVSMASARAFVAGGAYLTPGGEE